ncbi:MAG: hypothetical protein J6D11_01745 [Clostridia bacterium]|nr:hypothetical protein [Clostridia bacterium]
MENATKKQNIEKSLADMQKNNEKQICNLSDKCSLRDYAHLTRKCAHGTVWTEALQTALYEHETVEIPSSKEPYYIDNTVIIPSNRRIIAWRAVIKLVPECDVLMLRNEHCKDGTHAPFGDEDRDCNISIHGGCFAESRTSRAGYGKSGRFSPKKENDEQRAFYGVSTCMLFNNMDNLTLTDVTFSNTAGFAVQLGNVKNAVFENIWFKDCYADGLHLGGNCENVIARHIYGEVGDDLVALNAYDWQNSTVTFGPIKNVICENLNLSPMSPYKAIRIEPGIYTYADGSKVDCAIYDTIIKNVQGIKTFKIYLQTPSYVIGTEPEKGETGSVDNVFFEDIVIDLHSPIDGFKDYLTADPVRGTFAAFELGANIGYICFENINVKMYRHKFPNSYLACIGPKSIVSGKEEIFDPYVSSRANVLEFKNVTVNGEKALCAKDLVREISFDNVNDDGRSTASGKIDKILLS